MVEHRKARATGTPVCECIICSWGFQSVCTKWWLYEVSLETPVDVVRVDCDVRSRAAARVFFLKGSECVPPPFNKVQLNTTFPAVPSCWPSCRLVSSHIDPPPPPLPLRSVTLVNPFCVPHLAPHPSTPPSSLAPPSAFVATVCAPNLLPTSCLLSFFVV